MRNANALRIDPAPADRANQADQAVHERRVPSLVGDPDHAALEEATRLHWPMSWPAALYVGDAGADCTVSAFSASGAELTMASPPEAGTWVLLKFPFSIYLKGRVAWRRGTDLGLEFDAQARRSARIVEEVLVDRPAAC